MLASFLLEKKVGRKARGGPTDFSRAASDRLHANGDTVRIIEVAYQENEYDVFSNAGPYPPPVLEVALRL